MPVITRRRRDLVGALPEEIDQLLTEHGLEPYRSAQVVDWLYRHGARSFDEMTNLPKKLRRELAEEFCITDLKTLKVQISKLDSTRKLLLELHDAASVECVIISGGKRSTVCVSTQVGCAFGCVFCASGTGGLGRNLDAGEIVDQVRKARFDPDVGCLTNVVLMGMGEPLANYQATAKAVRIFLHKRGFALGKRHITISTAGYVPGILKLAQDNLPVRLALSLHATDNSTRSRLMPINRKYPIEQVLDSCRRLARSRQMPLTVEYMLIEGENDSAPEARKLAKICLALGAKVNLIPCNPVMSVKLHASSKERMVQFQAELRKAGVLAFVRRSSGSDIHAACGQLKVASAVHSV